MFKKLLSLACILTGFGIMVAVIDQHAQRSLVDNLTSLGVSNILYAVSIIIRAK